MVSRFIRKRRRLPEKSKQDLKNNESRFSKRKRRAKASNSNGNSKKNGNGNGNGQKKLTAKQAKFIDEYLVDLNGTQAAIRAGYSKKTAAVIASQFLIKLNIQAAIAKRREQIRKKVLITQEGVIQRYMMLCDYSIDDFFNDDGTMKNFSEIPKEKLYAIGGFKQSKRTLTKTDEEIITDRIKEFKLPSKRLVLDSLAKHLGMFDPKNQPPIQIQHNIKHDVKVPESVDRLAGVLGIILESGLIQRRLTEHSRAKQREPQQVIDA